MKRVFSFILGAIVLASVIILGLTYQQATEQRSSLVNDLERRTALLSDSLKESIRPLVLTTATSSMVAELNKFAGREDLVGLAIYNPQGGLYATSTGLNAALTADPTLAEHAMYDDERKNDFLASKQGNISITATPINQGDNIIAALVVYQHADYIDVAIKQTWNSSVLRLLIISLLFAVALLLIIRWIIYEPIAHMAEAIRQTRTGTAPNTSALLNKSHAFFRPIANEISKMSQSLVLARNVASEEARLRLEKLDSPWTAERLKEFFKAYFKDRQIVVISNREPYIHRKIKNDIEVQIPASGMITALEPIMESCGGLWLAQGSGNADHEVVDKNGKIQVPPDDPKYTLKRIWLTPEEVQGFYVGFSNEALWPLCHLSFTRPIFREEDWTEYRKVNGKFAQALLKEIKHFTRPIILIQDYHFALLPAMIKHSRPDAEIALFWHIPWPNVESFSICPWRKEILEGMLGADVVGFHTQQYCNNFLETVGKEIESLVDLEKFSVTHNGHMAFIKPFPISVAFPTTPVETSEETRPPLLDSLGIKTKHLGIGVDRMDYTKGIIERLRGIEFFFKAYPEYKGKFTFLQIAPPSREKVKRYREFGQEVDDEAVRINQELAEAGWTPIVLLREHHTHEEIYPLYRAADLCLVTSLSDGMNLVAKEFVSARTDEAGVLVLSKFTGASRDLTDALIINPYSAEDTAEALHSALTMTAAEQHRRMKKMRATLKNYTIYRWAAELLKAVTNLS